MNAGSQNPNPKPMTCEQVDLLLAEAAEGTLASAETEHLREHAAGCAVCGPLLAEAQRGRAWLGQLAEVEPPARLMRNILAATSYADPAMRKAPKRAAKGWGEMLRGFRPWLGPMAQPRLAGTFAMAFFSIALLLNIMGVHLTDIRNVDLRPHSIRVALSRTYYSTSARVARYYDSMRLVYEVQTRLQDLRNALPEQAQPEPQKQPNQKEQNNDKKNHSNYQNSQPETAPTYARAGEAVVAALSLGSNSALQFSPLFHAPSRARAPEAPRAPGTWNRRTNGPAEYARVSKASSREDHALRRTA